MTPEVRRATKKPVTIEYMVWPGGAENATPVINWIIEGDGIARYVAVGEEHFLRRSDDADSPAGEPFNGEDFLVVHTLEGNMRANAGDVIIRGVKGEHYPCKPDIFKSTYDLTGETTSTEDHRITLDYTVDDDGIHLNCSCGWSKVIGFEVDLPTLAIATSDHWENPTTEGTDS